jgi:NADH:ubiquinone oxidoreductase subunit H
MTIGWKYMLPISIANILVIALLVAVWHTFFV